MICLRESMESDPIDLHELTTLIEVVRIGSGTMSAVQSETSKVVGGGAHG